MYKIVVIDDNRAIAEMIATAIPWDKLECAVCGVAYNGIRGRDLIQRQHPDIIIADIHMPGMNGLDMIKNLRETSPQTKVIFISAYDDFAYAQQAVALHAHEYLLKPFENEKLMDSVRRAIVELAPPSEHDDGASASARFTETVLRYIEDHPDHPTLQEAAEKFGYSPSYIGTLIRKETGVTYIEWVARSRLKLAKKLLRNPSYRIEEVAQIVGYRNYVSFYQFFVKHEGVSPRDYRNGGEKS
ncbi:MAG: response regulator [Eubacteriales bacterium]|nr:response regulator [Eubacteriales bacterium]